MPPRPIIIDTDPGQDDAIAILLALACPDEIELLGITAVAGNVPLALTARNARVICDLAGRPDIAVHAGCDRPLQRDLITAENVHGRSGLDGLDPQQLAAPACPLSPVPAVDFLIDTLRARPAGTVTLCPIGPLTNIATALLRAPDIAGRIGQIVMMGGGFFQPGNITPVSEFNIHVDPEAAAIVLGAGVDLVMMPLDVTHQALVTPDRHARFAALSSPAGRAVAALTGHFDRYDPDRHGPDAAPLHDPCTIAYLLAPHLFSGRRINVTVETGSELTRGMTVADWWRVTDRPANALFIRDLDAAGFFDLLTDRLARL